MMFFRRISGESMLPSLGGGQIIIGSTRTSYREGDVVVVARNDKELIKRLKKIKSTGVWVEGDNSTASTDSRQFGWIDKSDILGVMKYALPIAVNPPKPRTKNGPKLGAVAASILVAFSLLHLFRIDTFVPEMTKVFNDNATVSFWAAALIVTFEVFALPFVMRMKLSPLAHYVSGAFAVLAPLFWLLVSVWTYGLNISTAQLGEFVSLPSNSLLVFANLAWVVLSYYTIWALGYDHRPNEKQTIVTKLFSRLSK